MRLPSRPGSQVKLHLQSDATGIFLWVGTACESDASGLHWVYNAVLGKMKGKSATALSHAQSDSDLLNVLVLAPLRNSRSNTDLFGCSFIDLHEGEAFPVCLRSHIIINYTCSAQRYWCCVCPL